MPRSAIQAPSWTMTDPVKLPESKSGDDGSVAEGEPLSWMGLYEAKVT